MPRADQPQKGRLVDLSKGMVDVVHPALLDDSESRLLKNATLDEKGTLRPCPGRIERFTSSLGTYPVAGMAPFYKPDGTSRLLTGTEDGKLYTDSPHIINNYDTQGDFNGGQNFSVQADSFGKLWPKIISTGFEDGLFDDFHTRDAGWTIDTTVYKTGAKSAKGTGQGQHLKRELGINAYQVYVKAAVRFGEADKIHYPLAPVGASNNYTNALVAHSDGHFKYWTGTAFSNFPVDKTYSANTWYIVEFWFINGAFWINIDDVSLTPHGLTLKDTSNNTVTQCSIIDFITSDSTVTAAMWIDDVTISLIHPVFNRASVAYKQDGSQVATNSPRFEIVGSRQAVMNEEGTINLLTANQASAETDTTGFAVVGSGVTITRDTTKSWHGLASLKVVCDGSVSGQGIYVWITKSSGSAVNYAGQVRSTGTGTVMVYLSGNYDAGTNSSNTTLTMNNSWQKGICARTCGVNDTMVNLVIKTTSTQAVTFWIDGLQLESEKLYASSWQLPGTARNSESLSISTPGVLDHQEATVEFTWIPQQPISSIISQVTSPTILQIGRYNLNNSLTLWAFYNSANLGSEPSLRLFVRGSTATSSWSIYPTILDSGTGWYVPGQPIKFAVKWITANTFSVAVNGVVYGPYAIADPLTGWDGNTLYLGTAQSVSFSNAFYNDVRISSRVRTDQEIANAYANGQPLTADDATTLLMPCNGNLDVLATHHWISPVIDCSNASDKASGHASLTATTPGASTVAISSRSAPASTGPWTTWAAALGDSTLQHTANNYVQVRLTLTRSGESDPYVDKLVVSFDGQPTATLLASDFVAGGQFFFTTLLSKMIVVNKLNAPRKYDGTTLSALGGNPPNAQYVAAHKNFLFMAHSTANPSRLYFSEVLNIESWPVLNFIDVSPNDGDWITGLLPYDDYLIITKNRSVWILVGSGTSDFEVRRLHAEIGCVAPRSLVRMGEAFAFVAYDGIYLSDRVQPVLISERLKKTWQGLNRRRLGQACAVYYDHKLRVDLPNGSSTINNVRIVYDAIRKAMYEREFSDHASCYTKFVEVGQEVLLYGHSNEGQVSQADTGTTDAGAEINFEWESKHFDNGLPEHIKRWRKVFMEFAPAASDTVVNVAFIVDGGAPSASIPVLVPGSATKKVHTARLLPSQVGVVQGHSIGYRVTQSNTNGGVGIHSCILDYFIKGARPTL